MLPQILLSMAQYVPGAVTDMEAAVTPVLQIVPALPVDKVRAKLPQ
jgi:hypothetical protein